MPAADTTYRDVADDLRRKIIEGAYSPGSYLPNANKLMARHGISTNTLSRAYKLLVADGLIRRVPRYGMLVLDPNPKIVDLVLHNPLGHGPLPWSECCTAAGLDGRMVTTSVTPGRADQEVADLLGIATGTETVIRARSAFVGDVPVRLDEAIYPHELVKGTPIEREQKVPGGIYATLTQAGHSPAAVTRRTVRARLAADDEAARLKLAKGSWVLTAGQVIADERGRAAELLRIVANPNRVQFAEEQLPV
ncbi:GntR family transcriptional regulator [Nonomuraea sp. MG754425]|uniref:GntR family transcriptional regulator n=1 Tax=Nonomuraea sp. MG754425 TaxID=2570319 RepID=UPI001F463E81|nr:GntR family transcriptional regulator [Nonomuraea sp. MG754425]